jgi:hypothetical protein
MSVVAYNSENGSEQSLSRREKQRDCVRLSISFKNVYNKPGDSTITIANNHPTNVIGLLFWHFIVMYGVIKTNVWITAYNNAASCKKTINPRLRGLSSGV